jgi:hypothetical protein
VLNPSAWARWKGILIENITKKQKQQQQHFFCQGSVKMKLPKNRIFNILKT